MLIKHEIIMTKNGGRQLEFNIMRYYSLTDYHRHDQSSQFLNHLNESVLTYRQLYIYSDAVLTTAKEL
ncbi:Uncharacterised protein [Escherichia coli]|nr:Uncharacterised protein [Escherichia coli]